MRRSAIAIGLVTALAMINGAVAAATTDGSTTDVTGGRTWYVATDGDDDGAGTSDDPFASWQRGIDAARDGDRVVVGPGTYSAGRDGVAIPRYASREAPVRFGAADPNDRPVLDCSGLDEDQFVCVEIDARWWHVSGVEIIGTPQVSESTPYAVLLDETRHVTFENVAVHDNHGVGIAIIDDSRHNLLRNVDAYRNQDELTDPPYENGDGIDLSGAAPERCGQPGGGLPDVVERRRWHRPVGVRGGGRDPANMVVPQRVHRWDDRACGQRPRRQARPQLR